MGFGELFLRLALKNELKTDQIGLRRTLWTCANFQVLHGLLGTFTDFSVSSMLACFTAESPKFRKFSLLAGTQVDFWGLYGFPGIHVSPV